MRAQITFRSGAQIEADTEEITTRDDFEGKLRHFKWQTPGDWTRKLCNLDLNEVVAIVAIRETEAS